MRERAEKVLIVESNPSIANAVETAGLRLHLNAERASDGWEAIEKLNERDYAAIVIDTDLPHFSGFGVMKFLWEERGNTLENVVLISASDDDTLRRKISVDHLSVVQPGSTVDQIEQAMLNSRSPK